MIELTRCNKLLDDGFSIITVAANKVPNFPWKEQQKTPLTKEELAKRYKASTTDNIGIVTGYGDLEVIDIDLKVFSTAKEQRDFWAEYLGFLKDNILDFDEKFVVYKTKNAGYHILYKSKRVIGNTKIASLKGHSEAIIETRGKGGYIFTYDGKNVSDKTYSDVVYISDEDREILWGCSKMYNYVEPQAEIIPAKTKKEYDSTGLTSWDDYNQKTSIFDLLISDFDIVANLSNKYVIKRKGAKSPHSGYIFKDTGCMYLFSTGTQYDAEKLHSPFSVFSVQNHRGDFSAAAKDLYNQGYGDRIKPKNIIENEPIIIPEQDLVFPIDVFPEVLQKYISVCNQTLNNSIDYMGCSLLFVGSIAIGNAFVMEVKRGWQETPNVWLALVGKAGVGKTPSINSITFPLEKLNNKKIKEYIKNFQKFDQYQELDNDQKKLSEEVKKPKKTQFIVNDITLEALVELHGENKNGIGVNKDELAGWFKDMNKYRQGSDLEHWLSSWSGKQINMNRKTARSAFVERAFIPVLGGIQPAIMDNFYTEENKASGFIDRMLFCYPELTAEKYSDTEMKQEYLKWYEDYIMAIYEKIKLIIEYTDDGEIEPIVARFTDEAKVEWVRVHDEIIDKQNSDLENEYMKSMLPKQLSYIPRFALIINTLESDQNDNVFLDWIEKESVLKAERLSKYFIAMAKKIKGQSTERNGIKFKLNKAEGKSDYERFEAVYDSAISKTELANVLGISRQTVYNYVKKIEANK